MAETRARYLNKNVLQIEEVDESWALELLNESERNEQDDVIVVAEADIRRVNYDIRVAEDPEVLSRPSAIELQKQAFEQRVSEMNAAQENTDDIKGEAGRFAKLRGYLGSLFLAR